MAFIKRERVASSGLDPYRSFIHAFHPDESDNALFAGGLLRVNLREAVRPVASQCT